MYKATTPEFNLIIPYYVRQIDKFIITLQQKGQTVLELTQESPNVVFEDNLITFTLTQEDTNIFVHRYPIHLQIKILLTSGRVIASNIVHIDVHKTLNSDILVPSE